MNSRRIVERLTRQSADVAGHSALCPMARADQLFSTLGTPVTLAPAINVSIHKFKAAKAFYV